MGLQTRSKSRCGVQRQCSSSLTSIQLSKLRWLARSEPEVAARVNHVVLPHDWLMWRLAGKPVEMTTDRGDASGTGYWSPKAGDYRLDLLQLAFGREVGLPRVAMPNEIVGQTVDGRWAGWRSPPFPRSPGRPSSP